MSIKIFVIIAVLVSLVNAGDSFNKVMAKNRSSKGIGQSNYKVIDGNKELEKEQKKGSIGLNITDKRVGTAYNYVEIKNVKQKKSKYDRKYGLAKFKKTPPKKKLYGVKASKNFKGNIHNTVKVKNSTLY